MEQPLALSKKESSHKSVTEFLNVTLLVTVSSSLLVLLCFGLALLAWFKISRRRSRDPQLLQHMEDSDQRDSTVHKGNNTSHTFLPFLSHSHVSSKTYKVLRSTFQSWLSPLFISHKLRTPDEKQFPDKLSTLNFTLKMEKLRCVSFHYSTLASRMNSNLKSGSALALELGFRARATKTDLFLG